MNQNTRNRRQTIYFTLYNPKLANKLHTSMSNHISYQFMLVTTTKDMSSTPSFVKVVDVSLTQLMVDLDTLEHPFPHDRTIHDALIPNGILNLSMCHCSWLKTMLFLSIQMAHSLISWRRCQIPLHLANFF